MTDVWGGRLVGRAPATGGGNLIRSGEASLLQTRCFIQVAVGSGAIRISSAKIMPSSPQSPSGQPRFPGVNIESRRPEEGDEGLVG